MPEPMPALPFLSVDFIVTTDDLVAANRLVERDGRPILFVTAAVLVLLGAVLWAASHVMGALFAVSGLSAAAVVVVPALWQRWIAWQGASLIGERRQLSFDEEGLHHGTAGLGRTLPWSTFTQLRVGRESVSFTRNGRLVQAIPSRAFSSHDDLQQLIDLASAHGPHIRITWDS